MERDCVSSRVGSEFVLYSALYSTMMFLKIPAKQEKFLLMQQSASRQLGFKALSQWYCNYLQRSDQVASNSLELNPFSCPPPSFQIQG